MDPKKILGVDRDATRAEIQRAYREKFSQHHPDRGGDARAFQQVQDAYQALTGGGDNDGTTLDENVIAKHSRQYKRETSFQPEADHHRSIADRWHEILVGELPLQSETTVFILINCLDIFMTWILLRLGAVEANPLANYFIQKWEFNGAIFFKLAIVALVCVIAQLVALQRPKTARTVLIAGSVIVGLVVVYSISLLWNHY